MFIRKPRRSNYKNRAVQESLCKRVFPFQIKTRSSNLKYRKVQYLLQSQEGQIEKQSNSKSLFKNGFLHYYIKNFKSSNLNN